MEARKRRAPVLEQAHQRARLEVILHMVFQHIADTQVRERRVDHHASTIEERPVDCDLHFFCAALKRPLINRARGRCGSGSLPEGAGLETGGQVRGDVLCAGGA